MLVRSPIITDQNRPAYQPWIFLNTNDDDDYDDDKENLME